MATTDGRHSFSWHAVRSPQAGLHPARVPEPIAAAAVKAGKLVPVLEPFAPMAPGVFLYYPSRHQMMPKLRAFIDHVKSRSDSILLSAAGKVRAKTNMQRRQRAERFVSLAAGFALSRPLPDIAISISRWPDAAFLDLRPSAGCEVPPSPASFRLLRSASIGVTTLRCRAASRLSEPGRPRRARDPNHVNLAIDSKLRGSSLAHERPLCAHKRPE